MAVHYMAVINVIIVVALNAASSNVAEGCSESVEEEERSHSS